MAKRALIQVKYFREFDVEPKINEWLREQSEAKIIDIKFTSALIIYEIEVLEKR